MQYEITKGTVHEDEFAQMRAAFEHFMPIDNELWSAMTSAFTTTHIKKGEKWVEAGKVNRYVAFIINGLFRSYYLHDGEEAISGFSYAPGFVTEYASFVQQAPATLTVEALEDSRLILFSYDKLQALYEEYPRGERLGRLIAEWIFVNTMDRNSSLMLLSPEERYRAFAERSKHLFRRVPLYMIASYLGMTPETLSRIRARIAKEHILA